MAGVRVEEKLEAQIAFHEKKAQDIRTALEVIREVNGDAARATGMAKLTKAAKLRAKPQDGESHETAVDVGGANGNGHAAQRLKGKALSAFLIEMSDETSPMTNDDFLQKLAEVGKPVKDARSITGVIASLVASKYMRKTAKGYWRTKTGLQYATEIKKKLEDRAAEPPLES
jgi:hypothetical protein